MSLNAQGMCAHRYLQLTYRKTYALHAGVTPLLSGCKICVRKKTNEDAENDLQE